MCGFPHSRAIDTCIGVNENIGNERPTQKNALCQFPQNSNYETIRE